MTNILLKTSLYKNSLILLYSALLIFLPVFAFSQSGKTPGKEAIDQVEKLKEKYQDQDKNIILTEGLSEFRFDISKEGDKVEVYENQKEELIGITSLQARAFRAQFYNEQSAIEEITIRAESEKGKKIFPDIEDEYYHSDDIFYSDAKLKYFTLNFSSPGKKYWIEYQKKYFDIKYFTSIYFNDILPTEKKTIRFIVPRWLNLELKEMNFENSGIESKTSYDSKLDADIFEYTAKNIPGISTENAKPGKSHIYPHILILAKSFTYKGNTVKLFESVGDLYHWYRELVGLMKNDREVLKEKVEELIADQSSDLEKIKSIYYWVQDNIRYIAFEDGLAGFKPDECQEVYKKRYGDCKGMANLTKEMLILAGYDARLTWIGTRHIAYDYSTPNLAVDNHMICTVLLDGKQYFLDPTDKYSSFDDYAERLQNRQVLIEDGDNYILSNVPGRGAEDNTRHIINKFKLDGDLLKGQVKRIYEGEGRSFLLYQINYTETSQLEEALNEFITQGDKNKKVSDLISSDFEDRDQLFTLDYSLEINNAVSSFEDEIYLEIDYSQELEGYEMDERETDYEFPYKLHLLIDTELELPEDYEVFFLPEPMKETFEGFSASISFEKIENKLFYQKEIIIDTGVLKKEKFEDWDQFISKLQGKYKEQIILTKKS
ncbi:MAG: transglutaminase domain-containing protein [Bacteroidetes bacterium]|nr:transglutaminase domain-containing protein [Bacteroidota bacterium]